MLLCCNLCHRPVILRSKSCQCFLIYEKDHRFICAVWFLLTKPYAMKKIYSLFLAAMFSVPFAGAKTTGIGIPNIFPHIGSGGSGSAAANYSRIIGAVHYRHNGTAMVPMDSTTYSYSHGRGGQLSREDMDDNFVMFDESYSYSWQASTGTYRNWVRRSQIFNIAGKASKYNCQKWNINTGTWVDSSRFSYTYNNDFTLLEKTTFDIFSGGIWAPHVTYQNYHDPSGNLIRMKSTVFIMNFSYDANNNLISRIDTQANITPFYWYGRQKLDFQYNSANQFVSYTVLNPSNGLWVNKDRFEYTYNGSNIAEIKHYSWNGAEWEVKGRQVMSYDTNNNLAKDEWQYWDVVTASYKSGWRKVWTYNMHNQPISYYSETFEPSTGNWAAAADDFLYRYYYQSYIPASVDPLDGTSALRLYPQPANNLINVELPAQAGNTSVSILDAQGRTVKYQQVEATGKIAIDVSGLVNGVYFLRTHNKQGALSRQFIISR